ncbi:MAG TPA: hypothetical protein DCY94_01730, partial [Firmicutes bacterium]|nr:hypothetical protein [Bacillota bacterium]
DLESSLKEFTEEKKRGDRKYGVISILKSKIFGISIIIADFVGFTMLSNSFTFIDLLTISSLYGVFHSSCEKIADTLILYSKYRAVLRNVSEFYDLETEASATSLKPKLNRVRIDDLSFSYNRIDYTLKNFSYEFNIGENLIIKGPSGVGKSTLVKCLSAYNRDYDGNIYFDDKSLKGLNAGYIRKNVIYIGQEERLFTKTIRENVTLGEYDEKWFDRVSKMTKLDAIIDKKRDGARAMLLEGASNLSGGERARVVLARALYQNPRILIIDETLSNVGESDEDEILKNLLSLKNISIIYITHRKKEYLFDNIIEFRKDGRYEITRKRSHRN